MHGVVVELSKRFPDHSVSISVSPFRENGLPMIHVSRGAQAVEMLYFENQSIDEVAELIQKSLEQGDAQDGR